MQGMPNCFGCCNLQEIGQAQSLDGVRAAHGKFLDAAARQCLLVPTRTWRLLQDAVLRILDLILKFADLRHRLKVTPGMLPLLSGISPSRLAIQERRLHRQHMPGSAPSPCRMKAWTLSQNELDVQSKADF